MNITVIDQNGESHRLAASAGSKVMEVIRDAGLSIAAQCGGCCSCATCHVYVGEAWRGLLPPRGEDEEAMLELAMDVQPNSRLSCQIEIADNLDGLEVTLAPGTQM